MANFLVILNNFNLKSHEFFKYSEDIYEKRPISTINLTEKENEVFNLLKKISF